jgi:hypothetical protein
MNKAYLTPEDKELLNNVRKKLMEIKMDLCTFCHEEWFDLNALDGACSKCHGP